MEVGLEPLTKRLLGAEGGVAADTVTESEGVVQADESPVESTAFALT